MDDSLSLFHNDSSPQAPESSAEKLLAEMLTQLIILQDPLRRGITVFPNKIEIRQMDLEKFCRIAEKITTLHKVAKKIQHILAKLQKNLIQQVRECLLGGERYKRAL